MIFYGAAYLFFYAFGAMILFNAWDVIIDETVSNIRQTDVARHINMQKLNKIMVCLTLVLSPLLFPVVSVKAIFIILFEE